MGVSPPHDRPEARGRVGRTGDHCAVTRFVRAGLRGAGGRRGYPLPMSSPPFLDLPARARAYRLATGRGDFAVHDALPTGPAKGTALLVPGFTGSKEDFIALLAPLSGAGFRTVAMDQRGQYETGGPNDEAAYRQPEAALDMLAVAAELGRDGSPVHVLGHSFGGLVVRAAALDHGPVPWASLTILSSGPGAIDEGEAARMRMLLEALPSLGLERVWEAMQELDEVAGPAPGTGPEVTAFLHRRWLANVPEQLTAAGAQLLAEPDRVDELASVPLPKLVLSGSSDDAWQVPWYDDMARRLGARRVVVEGAGHSPNAERPEETARALVSFWESAGAPESGTAGTADGTARTAGGGARAARGTAGTANGTTRAARETAGTAGGGAGTATGTPGPEHGTTGTATGRTGAATGTAVRTTRTPRTAAGTADGGTGPADRPGADSRTG